MPANPLVGYFRLNPERLRREMARNEIANYQELAARVNGAISQSTLDRLIYDKVNPSAAAIYAITTLFKARVEDLFDPVPGEVPAARPESTRSA